MNGFIKLVTAIGQTTTITFIDFYSLSANYLRPEALYDQCGLREEQRRPALFAVMCVLRSAGAGRQFISQQIKSKECFPPLDARVSQRVPPPTHPPPLYIEVLERNV